MAARTVDARGSLPMTIRFRCPSGHWLSVPDHWTGRTIRCAGCDEDVRVPERSADGPSPTTDLDDPPPPARPAPRLAGVGRLLACGLLLPSTWATQMTPDVYRADKGHRATVRFLAAILALVVAFSIAPVVGLGHLNPATAPNWARAILLVAMVQAAYVAWMLNVPDWASVWVVMLVFAGAAALYALAMAVALATPPERPMILDMDQVRRSARAWCGAVGLVTSLATYLCGRTATRWRRIVELQMADRHQARD